MHNIYLKDLLNIDSTILINGDVDTILDNFCIDTRLLNKGDIFVGIKGDTFDGSTMYEEALKKGAKGCILNNNNTIDENAINNYPNSFIVLVSDTIKCIQELAKYKRSLYDIPVVAITGSVGKTSTKDMVASVLSQKYNVLKTIGNYNNHLGVPLTILRLQDEDCAVIEMGMNNLGEISVLTNIAKPTVAIITNVGTAHIGNLGSRENILKAKLEILEGMNDKVLITNNDNDLLKEYCLNNSDNIKIITYGLNDSNYKAYDIVNNEDYSIFNVSILGNTYEFKVNVPGSAFIYNSLCAISTGIYLNVSIKDIKIGVENFSLTHNRMEKDVINDITIINDSYNANLDSVNNALNCLGTLKGRKIAVLGDMLELGDYSEKLHRNVAKTIIDNKINITITVGMLSKYIKDELNKNNYNNVYSYDTLDEAYNKIISIINKNDIILFKASNGMHFNDLCNNIKKYLNE